MGKSQRALKPPYPENLKSTIRYMFHTAMPLYVLYVFTKKRVWYVHSSISKQSVRTFGFLI